MRRAWSTLCGVARATIARWSPRKDARNHTRGSSQPSECGPAIPHACASAAAGRPGSTASEQSYGPRTGDPRRKRRSPNHMELKQVIGRRRTIRIFLPYRPVEREKVQKMLEAARRASCAGNVMNARAIVIWREKADPKVIKAIAPRIGYQQMHTAPVFIFWYSESSVYHGDAWPDSVLRLPRGRRGRLRGGEHYAEGDHKPRPMFFIGR